MSGPTVSPGCIVIHCEVVGNEYKCSREKRKTWTHCRRLQRRHPISSCWQGKSITHQGSFQSAAQAGISHNYNSEVAPDKK